MIAINRSVGTKIVIYSTVRDLSVLINFLDLWLTIQIEFVQFQIHGHHLMQIIVGYDSCNLKWCQITIINISEKPQPKRRAIKRTTNWEAFDRACDAFHADSKSNTDNPDMIFANFVGMKLMGMPTARKNKLIIDITTMLLSDETPNQNIATNQSQLAEVS